MFTEERVDNAVEELYQVSISGQQVLDVSNKCSIFRREVVFGDRKCCSVDYVKPENLRTSFVKPPKIEPIESSYSEIQKRKQKKEERYIRETNGVGQNYILGERFQS